MRFSKCVSDSNLKYVLGKALAYMPLIMRRRLLWIAQPKFTMGVSGIVLNERNEVLLLRHRFRENDNWQFPGGFAGRGEQPDTVLQREVLEETGLEIKVCALVMVRVVFSLHLDVYFLGRVQGGEMTIDYREAIDAKFFSLEEVSIVLDQAGMEILQRALESMDSGPG